MYDITDLKQLKSVSDWLSDDNELPSSGDAACVCDAVDEIAVLRALIVKLRDKLEYGDAYQWDDGDECWGMMRDIAFTFDT